MSSLRRGWLNLVAAVGLAAALACAHEPETLADSSVSVEVGPGGIRASTAGLDIDEPKLIRTMHALTVAALKKHTRYPIVGEAGEAPRDRSFYVDPVVSELERTPTKLRCVVEMTLSMQPKLVPFMTMTSSATVPDANDPRRDALGECIRAAVDDVVANRVVESLRKRIDSHR